MIDLSQYEIGQRFRTRGGFLALLSGIERRLFKRTIYRIDIRIMHDEFASLWDCSVPFRKDGISKDGKFALLKPLYAIPANTRRIPSIQLDHILEKAV